MARVIIESSDAASTVIDAPEGGRLLDLCDDTLAPIPFSCRSANCGTCRVDVLEGIAELSPPEGEELAVLAIFGDDPTKRRLACCAIVIASGSGSAVRVRAVSNADDADD